MRTTVRLNESLMKQVKSYATQHNQTLTKTIEDALREKLARQAETPRRKPYRAKVYQGEAHGLQAGVDLSDNSALLDLMEGR